MRISDWSSDVCSSDLLHHPRDLAMSLGAAPDMALAPHRMLAQLMNRVVIVAGDLVGQRQCGGIEDPGLGAEELEQARGFLKAEPRKGPPEQRSVEQQYARRGRARPQATGGTHSAQGEVQE